MAADIQPEGLDINRRASEKERAQICRELALVHCETLSVNYTLSPSNHGTFELKGILRAKVTQNCVITLEPIQALLEEKLRATYAHSDLCESSPSHEDQAILNQRSIEPIRSDKLEVGRLVFETFSSSIDPYPKKPGAKLEVMTSLAKDQHQDDKSSPFAALAQLKDGTKKN